MGTWEGPMNTQSVTNTCACATPASLALPMMAKPPVPAPPQPAWRSRLCLRHTLRCASSAGRCRRGGQVQAGRAGAGTRPGLRHPRRGGRGTGWWLGAALAAVVMVLASLSSACEPGEMQRLAQLPTATEEAPAGPAVQPGPRAWIEYPWEGQTLPLEPLVFIVYATDAQGVAQVELLVNGNPLPAALATGAGPGNSRSLVRLEQQWTPDKEGEYIAEARGRNSAGGYGEPAFVKFCIGSCEKKGPTPTPPLIITETPAPVAQYDLYIRRMDFSPAHPLTGEKIELFIMIATDTYPEQGPFFPASHFRWRKGPELAWQEGVCPPNNQYAQCSTTVVFSYDAPGSYEVQVEADSQQEVAEKDETNNVRSWVINVGRPTPTYTPTGTAKPPTPTYTPTPTGTPTIPPPPPATEAPPPLPADIQFWADSDNIPAGSCTTVHWHVAHVKAYWVDGNPGAGDDGGFQACPCQEEMHTLHVVKQDNSEQDLAVTIHVSGECAAPPPPPPTEGPPPPPPPQDTTGPSFSGIGVTKKGCKFYGYADVSDPSGVAWAQFYYRLGGGGWQNVGMNEKSYGHYDTDEISVSEGVVSIEYYVQAADYPGNPSESAHANDNVGCIE
jgi:hypothetical protein